MAKFKVGDRVTDGDAVYEITDVDDGIYEWKVVSGKADRSYSAGGEITWADNKMRLANSAVRSTNAVVQNALNARAVRNGYVVLRTASGGTAKVYEGDRVSYAGEEYVAKALGSPQMDKATLVDGSGNKLIVRLKDVDLKALNARTARNADGDGAAVKAIMDLQRRIAPLAREAEAMRGKFIANKWYGYDAALEFIAKRLKEAEAEGKW